MLTFSLGMHAQKMDKKVKTLLVKRTLPFSAEKVWSTVAEDYGNIANMHPKIVSSKYEAGSLKGALGAQRFCSFNEKNSRVLHEKIVGWDPENMTLINRVVQSKKFPVDTENTRAIYKVTPLDNNQSEFSIYMEYRTKPALMGGMMKGSFRKLLSDYMISVEHHLATGEAVTAANFKDIRKQYN